MCSSSKQSVNHDKNPIVNLNFEDGGVIKKKILDVDPEFMTAIKRLYFGINFLWSDLIIFGKSNALNLVGICIFVHLCGTNIR